MTQPVLHWDFDNSNVFASIPNAGSWRGDAYNGDLNVWTRNLVTDPEGFVHDSEPSVYGGRALWLGFHNQQYDLDIVTGSYWTAAGSGTAISQTKTIQEGIDEGYCYYPSIETIFTGSGSTTAGITLYCRFKYINEDDGAPNNYNPSFSHLLALGCGEGGGTYYLAFGIYLGAPLDVADAPSRSICHYNPGGQLIDGRDTLFTIDPEYDTPPGSYQDAPVIPGNTYTYVLRATDDDPVGDGNRCTITLDLTDHDLGKHYRYTREENISYWKSWSALWTSLVLTDAVGLQWFFSGRWVLNEIASGNPFRGYVDYAGVYERSLDDDEVERIVEQGVSIPWVAPDYTILDHNVRVAHTNESSPFPVTRQLPVGSLSGYLPAGAWGTRMRLKYEGFLPARPWALRRTSMQFDAEGPRGSSKNKEMPIDAINGGFTTRPGQHAANMLEDVRNMEFSGISCRRRRGFKVRKNFDWCENASNALIVWRSWDDQLHQGAKADDSLYIVNGDAIATGFALNELPDHGVLGNRCIIVSRSKQLVWAGGTTTYDFGADAPISGSRTTTTGSLTGTYKYAYTLVDSNTGDETGPYEIGSAITVLNQGVYLQSLEVRGGRWDKQYIYRTSSGGAIYYLIDTQDATTYFTDGGLANGTIQLPGTADIYTGMEWPEDDFQGCHPHLERMFYWGGSNYPARVVWSEPNSPATYFPKSLVTCEAPVRAVMSQGTRLIVFTDYTVELIESDYIRDEEGDYQISRRVLSRKVGAAGHDSVVDADGRIFWIGHQGIYELRGDKVVPISGPIRDVFPYVNWSLAPRFSGAYNHIRRQVIWCVAADSFQFENNRLLTQIVMSVDGEPTWSIYDMNLSHVTQFDDDQAGIKFGGMNGLGCWVELESYEGDGVDDPDTDFGGATSGTITSAGIRTFTDNTKSWTAEELAGCGVITRRPSTGEVLYWTIRNNSSNTIQLDSEFYYEEIEVGDQYWIGGINAYIETQQQGFGSSNRKALRFIYYEFDDLTERAYL